MSEAYEAAWRESISDPETFWSRAANAVEWFSKPHRAYSEEDGWFPGGTLNTAYNCLDRHVAEVRRIYGARLDTMLQAMSRHFPGVSGS